MVTPLAAPSGTLWRCPAAYPPSSSQGPPHPTTTPPLQAITGGPPMMTPLGSAFFLQLHGPLAIKLALLHALGLPFHLSSFPEAQLIDCNSLFFFYVNSF
ncbi:hypothetical protein GOP47_0025096 [Adiantum capillus-veneris]|uniref:Uncharacterized protein n=1 Tax=Adiantum capillus-veneris TaxID=13818 RepID=A0A9D4U5L5_ADICA|nr:hypothetical protein GOP47_0025096 [Adiantum capillus-veneris]